MIIGNIKLPLVFEIGKFYVNCRQSTNEEITSITLHEFTSSLEYNPRPTTSNRYKKKGKSFTSIPLGE